MSFSNNIREEICELSTKARHCNIAELSALLNYNGEIKTSNKNNKLVFYCERALVAKRIKNIIYELFASDLKINISENTNLKKSKYSINIENQQMINDILISTGFTVSEKLKPLITQKECCKKAYIRGSFLSIGSVSEPKKAYHLEFVNASEDLAIKLLTVINSFGLSSKIIDRKSNFILYLKESGQIADLLNIIGAHKSLMDFENTRIWKDVRNNTNRFVNCETANLGKTIKASLLQKEDILLVKETRGLFFLSDALREVAEIRLEYPDITLKEIGEKASPKVSKSGVNHRFKKINKIADDIRGGAL